MNFAGTTKADSEAPPRDYVKASADGRFELVMLPTYRYARKDPNLRKRYRQSGLYRKGVSNRPLWTIDWYAWQIYPASDGHHLIRMGPWPSSAQDLAVAFYRDGKLLRQFKINQLVKDPESLPHSVSHFMWSKTIDFNDAKRQLRLTTLLDEKYLFDAEGRLLEGRLIPPYHPKSLADGFLYKGDARGLIGLGAAALPEIMETIRTGIGRRQETAFLALCANGKASLLQVAALSRDTKSEVRMMAAAALLEISAPEGKPILLRLLQDKDSHVRIAAIAGLAQIHEVVAGSAAVLAARIILRSGTDSEKQELLFALNRFRVPALVPDVLPLLEIRPTNAYSDLFQRTNYWLESTTFQNFEPLNSGSDARQKMARAWSNWWGASKHRTSDEWYAQAVERDISFLSGESSQLAADHLAQLTGRSFYSGDNAPQAASLYRKWWKNNIGRRPGQILIDSIALTQKTASFSSSEALMHLVLQCDERDVPDLVALYQIYPAKNGWDREYVEMALRRITNVDSFGLSFTAAKRTQDVIQAWKRFAA